MDNKESKYFCAICSYKQKCEFVLKHYKINIYYNFCEPCNLTFQTTLRNNLTKLALDYGGANSQ